MKTLFTIVAALILVPSVFAQDTTQIDTTKYRKLESNADVHSDEVQYDTIASGSAGGTIKPVENVCSNRNELREEVRLKLRPYKYCLARTTMINMKRYPQLKYVIVPIYSDHSHKIIFSTRGMPQGVRITVYNGPKSKKKREVLYQSTLEPGVDSFELPENYKHDYLYIEYDIPPTEQEDRTYDLNGCVIFMMGYQFLPDVINEDDSMDTMEGEDLEGEE